VIRVASCFCNTFEKLFELEANRRGSSVILSPKSIADRTLREPSGYAAGSSFVSKRVVSRVDQRLVKVGQKSSRQPIDSGGTNDMIPPPSAEQEMPMRRNLTRRREKSLTTANL
jgi:hypothetical protein